MRSLSIHALLTLLVSLAVVISGTNGVSRIDLGLAKPYAILAGATVHSSDQDGTVVTGDIGIFPGKQIKGFPPGIHHGDVDAANDAARDAQDALTAAYNDVSAREANATLTGGDLGGMTLLPGVYKFGQTANMHGNLTLDADGDAAAVWIFQIGSAFKVSKDSCVNFVDRVGNPEYVYWTVGASVSIEAGVRMVGNIMTRAAVKVGDGASVRGRILAQQAAVSLDNNIITRPSTAAFRAIQTVEGVSLTLYNNDPELNTATLKQAIAETMTGVLPGDIYSFKVTAGPTTETATTEVKSLRIVHSARALTTTESIILNYDVILSSTLTSEELQAQLRAAVEDGTFNDYLHDAATENGATDLGGVSSESVRTETITDDNGDSSSGLTGGAIAGIVIGIFFAVVIVALIIYFFACRGNNASVTHKSTAVSTQDA